MIHIGSIFAMAVCLCHVCLFQRNGNGILFFEQNQARRFSPTTENVRAALALKLAENYDRLDLYHSDWKQYRKHYHSIRRYAFVRRSFTATWARRSPPWS